MRLPARLQVIAAMVGMHSRDFSIGWANGMVRWEGRVRRKPGLPLHPEYPDIILSENLFPRGSVKWAASEAAVTFMKELDP